MAEQWRKVNALEQVMLEDYHPLPNKPLVITVSFSLAKDVDFAWLKSTVIPRFITHPRFSSRLTIARRGIYRFEPVPDFTPDSPDLDYHLNLEATIDAKESPKERLRLFRSRVSEIMSQPLDMSRPLWSLHLFPAWSMLGIRDSSTIILRVHHSLCDGIGLVKYFLATIADPDSQNNPARLLVSTRRATKARKLAEEKVGCLRKISETLNDVYQIFIKPFKKPPVSVLNRAPVQENNLCDMKSPDEITVASLKASTTRLHVTINDLLFAAFAGAIREYVKFCGDDPRRLKGMTVAMPFNKHVFEEFNMSDVSNQLLMIPVKVPVHLDSPVDRLEYCSKKMQQLKRGYQPYLAAVAMAQLLALPSRFRRKAWHRLGSSATALFSNVAGPREVLKIDGIDVPSVYFFPPPNVQVAVDFGIFSYAGSVYIGAAGDSNRLSHPQKLVELFVEQVMTISQLAEAVG